MPVFIKASSPIVIKPSFKITSSIVVISLNASSDTTISSVIVIVFKLSGILYDNLEGSRLLKEALVTLRPKIQPKNARSPVLTVSLFLVISAVDALLRICPTNGRLILPRLSQPIKAA